ncbi:MAG: serine/threonine-protein kinase [Pseudomonadota bacterium]
MQSNATHLSDCESDDLSPGHALLYGQYEIERHLIGGGFGMTYLARDSLDRRVVIKECFPSAVCRRVNGEVRPHKPDYQEQYQKVIRSFLREALRMAKFDHPNIVKVHQVFQENNTAYIAMDYVDGMDLLTMLEIDPGRLTDALIESLLRETLNALAYVHELGMLHRDISPDNLLLDANNKLTMIDFGAAREETARQTRALTSVMSVKDGYSPHEFYYTDGDQQPSSDIYSVGATFYHLITGSAPPDCQKRVAALSSRTADPFKPLAKGKWTYGASFLSAIDKALSISQKDRFQSTQEWLELLEGVSSAETCTTSTATAATTAENEPEVELGPELVAKISSLVEDTNTKVKLEAPKNAEEQESAEPEVADEPTHLVDIFGQPIDNVEKWLKEQDEQPKRKSASVVQETVVEEQPEEAQADSSGFGLLRVFRKLSKIRSRSVA